MKILVWKLSLVKFIRLMGDEKLKRKRLLASPQDLQACERCFIFSHPIF